MVDPRCLAYSLVGGLCCVVAQAQSLLQEDPIAFPALPSAFHDVTSAVAADIDGDGDEDLVFARPTGLEIWRRTGGVLVPEVMGLAGPAGRVLAVADFDGDGFLDLLYGPSGQLLSLWIYIRWGDGSGNWLSSTETTVSVPPDSKRFTVADVDGDGDLDVLIAAEPFHWQVGGALVRNYGGRVLTLAPVGEFPTTSAGVSTAYPVDVDADGALDVVMLSSNGTTRLYWNDAGNFVEATPAQFPLLQQGFGGLLCEDFDGDGDKDLLFGGSTGRGVMLRTTGLRQLTLDAAPVLGAHALSLLALDCDGDGDLDVHAFTRDRDHLWRNDGTGVFTVAASYGGSQDVRLVVPFDLDGDGDRDYLRIGQNASSPATVTVTVAYTVVPGTFDYVGASRLPVSHVVIGPALGDIDGDGLGDIILSNNEVPNGGTLQFALNDGRGVFAFDWASRTGGISNGFFGDLDGDGRDEYVFSIVAPSYLANDHGVLASTPTPLPSPPFGTTQTGITCDLDGDGQPELVFGLGLGNYQVLRVLVRQAGTWVDDTATRVSGPPITGSTGSLRTADFDGDGDLDVWFHTSAEEQIWRNVGGVLTYVPAGVPINGWGGSRGSIGDLDGDGDLDLHAGRYVMLNRGDGTFVASNSRVPNISSNESLVWSADVDDDGDLDLIGAGVVLWNDGNAFFSVAPNVLPFGYGTGGGVVHMADVDRDGDPDAIVSLTGSRAVLINQLRQLRLFGTAALGGSLDFQVTVRPGAVAIATTTWIACSPVQIPPTLIPDLGWVQIDPTQMFVLGPWALPATGGDVSHQEPIPNAPALLGARLCAQTVELRGSRVRVGNLVSTWLGR